MKESVIEKKQPVSLKEKTLYSLLIIATAAMLYFADFFIFPLLFIGVLGFFIWKVFSIETHNDTRQIFEFYLSANEILREDERRWYGFEIHETIRRGEAVVRSMSAPPLVHFALGALYQKLDDHSSAVKHLSHVVGESVAPESSIVFPTKELREYVRMLRKIERTPAEAPLTSSAVRTLERLRKNKGKQLLEYSLSQVSNAHPKLPLNGHAPRSVVETARDRDLDEPRRTEVGSDQNGERMATASSTSLPAVGRSIKRANVMATTKVGAETADRKSISEVLHDIYEDDVH